MQSEYDLSRTIMDNFDARSYWVKAVNVGGAPLFQVSAYAPYGLQTATLTSR